MLMTHIIKMSTPQLEIFYFHADTLLKAYTDLLYRSLVKAAQYFLDIENVYTFVRQELGLDALHKLFSERCSKIYILQDTFLNKIKRLQKLRDRLLIQLLP